MTVETESIVPQSYTLDGITADWTVPFKMFDASELDARIVSTDAEGIETETVLMLSVDYTISDVLDSTNEPIYQSTLTLNPAGTNGKRLVLNRVLPITRSTRLDPGPFPAKAVDHDLDRGVMVDQQLQEQIDRSVKLPSSTELRGLAFPNPPAVGSDLDLIGWNADRTALINTKVEQDQIDPPDSHVTTKYWDDIVGLDFSQGATGNAAILEDFLEALSAEGGGKLVGDGRTIDILESVSIPSFITVEALKIRLGPTATFGIAGRKAVLFAGVRLVSSVSAAATTMAWDTSVIGGGVLSSYLNVGAPFSISDGANSESGTVTAIDDGTRTVTVSCGGTGGGLQYAYTVSGAVITIDDCARLASELDASL